MPGLARAADTFQLGCYPYGNPDFAFNQYISGWGRHMGEDVCHEAGTPIYAAGDGVVVYSAQTPNSYRWGNLIMIQHDNPGGSQVVTLYGHMNSDRRVAAGQRVNKGDRIGTVGQQGDVNGNWEPHLHFGVHAGAYGYPAGTYAPYIHGYEQSCCAGWMKSSEYVNDRIASFDNAPTDFYGDTTMYNNGETQFTFRFRNTGSQTWRKDGPQPTRLGTIMPRDRGSGFSQNGAAAGWVGPNRIQLQNDVPSGGLAVFTATFKSHGVAGSYPECFSPVVDNLGWMPERKLCATFTVLPPMYRAQWHSQLITNNFSPTDLSNPTNANYMLPGDKRSLKLFVKNTGELPWDAAGANPVRVTTARNLDRTSPWSTLGDNSITSSENWVTPNRPSALEGRYEPGSNSVVADTQITQGEIAAFSFAVTAPDIPGNFMEYFQPVIEGKYHFPDMGIWYDLRVADRGYHYQYVTQNATPSTIGQTNTTQDITLQVRNTGRESWPVGGDLRLATDQPRDHQPVWYTPSGTGSWVSPNRPSAIDRNVTTGATSGQVNPGEVAEFSFRLTVPTTLGTGTYKFYVRPVKDGVTFFPEDYGIHFPVTITVPPYKHEAAYQSWSGDINNFTKGTSMTADLGLKNVGRATWNASGANPVHLATERPKDRTSGFADFAAGNPWISGSRASAIDGRVTSLPPSFATTADSSIEPNEIAWFRMTLKANPNPGTYNEYFNLVKEGITWYSDLGIFFPLTVTP